MKAITAKHQANVNRAMLWLEKYNAFNDQRDQADGDGDEAFYRKLDTKCERAFDKFLTYMDELPKNQQKVIYNHPLY